MSARYKEVDVAMARLFAFRTGLQYLTGKMGDCPVRRLLSDNGDNKDLDSGISSTENRAAKYCRRVDANIVQRKNMFVYGRCKQWKEP